jgi:hypothetical protein
MSALSPQSGAKRTLIRSFCHQSLFYEYTPQPSGDSLDLTLSARPLDDLRPHYPVSCTTRMPCRRVMRALGQRATAAR